MKNFNPEQNKAIHFFEGPFMCIAGPGSGKTTVLVNRAANMISEYHVKPEEMLVVTFSKEAARTMGERFNKLTEGKINGVVFCTIHSFCLTVLSNEGINNARDIVKWMEVRHMLVEKIKEDDNIDISDVNRFIADIMSKISYAKNKDISPEESIQYETEWNCTSFHEYYRAYEDYKKETGTIDFDDMLIKTRDLFRTKPDVLERWRNRFKYIMIDEFQDTNDIQAEILYGLAAPLNNLFIVGDDDQSLYEFRGAEPSIMLNFPKKFKNCQTVYLSVNYRSETDIVKKASNLISNNKKRFDKNIVGNTDKSGIVHKYSSANEMEESLQIVSKIKEQMLTYKPTEIAILCRINREVSYAAKALSDAGIPFYAKDAIQNPHDSWLFKTILAYVDIIMDNDVGRQVSYIIDKPTKYIPKDVYYRSGGSIDLMIQRCYDLYDDKKAKKISQNLTGLKNDIRFVKNATYKNAGEFVQYIVSIFGVERYITDHCSYVWEDSDSYFDMLHQFIDEASKFVTPKEYREYIFEKDTEFQKNKSGDINGVWISTMHRAKGLEWDCVNIINLNHGKCPYIPKKKADDVSFGTEKNEIESERRVMYVAITRARKECNLYFCTDSGKEKSEFLAEIEAVKK